MTDQQNLIRVAVIYGGQSSEHSVACVTGHAILHNMDTTRFTPIPVGITRDGTWVVGTTDSAELTMRPDYQPEVRPREELRLAVSPQHKGQFYYVSGEHAGELYAEVDVIFPALHGHRGEDGTIQGLFELSGIAYVGCGVLASAAGMDKTATKLLLQAAGLSVAPQVVVTGSLDEVVDDIAALGLPVYVKPASGGSSIGVSKVTHLDDLAAAVAAARKEDHKVLVEREMVGPEVEVAIVEYPDGRLRAATPAQLQGTTDSAQGFYDFDTKYLANTVQAAIPAPIGEEAIAEIQQLALRAFQALGARGLSRVDFFLTDDGPVVNEINTMPGFTPISMYPQEFAYDGVSYPELLGILIEQALHSSRT
ncbi:D-alanine--D-alanine ligase family protein [Corynebacterium choanae]|uniref:D-alanine--D-alanine ligase n=1 Tax=Corynebacterium choanae TaxID=1862358 RepID=A0A3G6J945_9CORY|nr:D-alanine--D-alanine ligase family protein [Corynebacterium choanae]AZA13408.1 D-alanine--D-alanine ligase [Corynebacterium choanae]